VNGAFHEEETWLTELGTPADSDPPSFGYSNQESGFGTLDARNPLKTSKVNSEGGVVSPGDWFGESQTPRLDKLNRYRNQNQNNRLPNSDRRDFQGQLPQNFDTSRNQGNPRPFNLGPGVENDVGQKESQGASSRIPQEFESMTDEQRRQFKGGKAFSNNISGSGKDQPNSRLGRPEHRNPNESGNDMTSETGFRSPKIPFDVIDQEGSFIEGEGKAQIQNKNYREEAGFGGSRAGRSPLDTTGRSFAEGDSHANPDQIRGNPRFRGGCQQEPNLTKKTLEEEKIRTYEHYLDTVITGKPNRIQELLVKKYYET
jgi:hypothetical protein